MTSSCLSVLQMETGSILWSTHSKISGDCYRGWENSVAQHQETAGLYLYPDLELLNSFHHSWPISMQLSRCGRVPNHLKQRHNLDRKTILEKTGRCILNTNSGICSILYQNRKCKTQVYKYRNKLGVFLVSRTRDCKMKVKWESKGKDTGWRLEWGNRVWRKALNKAVATLERTGTMVSQKKKWKWVMKYEKAIFFLMISFTKLSRVLKGKNNRLAKEEVKFTVGT